LGMGMGAHAAAKTGYRDNRFHVENLSGVVVVMMGKVYHAPIGGCQMVALPGCCKNCTRGGGRGPRVKGSMLRYPATLAGAGIGVPIHIFRELYHSTTTALPVVGDRAWSVPAAGWLASQCTIYPDPESASLAVWCTA